MYFSTHASYVLSYMLNKPRPAFLMVLLAPGNAFPVVEQKDSKDSLLGLPLRGGYQSHIVLTRADGDPIQTPAEAPRCFDEIVIAQETQVVPVYIVELRPEVLSSLAGQLLSGGTGARDISSGPGASRQLEEVL